MTTLKKRAVSSLLPQIGADKPFRLGIEKRTGVVVLPVGVFAAGLGPNDELNNDSCLLIRLPCSR